MRSRCGRLGLLQRKASLRVSLASLLSAINFPAVMLLGSAWVMADDSPAPPSVAIPRIHRPLSLEELIDGNPEQRAAVISGFVQRDPPEGEPASQLTTAYLAYDDQHLYVGLVCADSEPEKIRARVTPRDSIYMDDHVGVIIDTYYDHRRAYFFAANPLGIQSDSLTTESSGEDRNFDALWHSQGRLTSQGYAVLLRIPFKSLRFSPRRTQREVSFLPAPSRAWTSSARGHRSREKAVVGWGRRPNCTG